MNNDTNFQEEREHHKRHSGCKSSKPADETDAYFFYGLYALLVDLNLL